MGMEMEIIRDPLFHGSTKQRRFQRKKGFFLCRPFRNYQNDVDFVFSGLS